MHDARIEAKEDKFIETFQGIPLYFIVEEVFGDIITKPKYKLVFVTTNESDFHDWVADQGEDSKEVLHLFKSSIFGQTIEWVESYNGYTKMCDVSLDLDEASWAILAQLSLQRDKPVNDVLVDVITEYARNKEGICQEPKETFHDQTFQKKKRN